MTDPLHETWGDGGVLPEEAEMDVKQSITIAVPPERVWPLLVDPANVMRWYTTLREYRYVDEAPHGTGTRIYAEERGPGMLMKLDFEVTDWDEDRSLALHMIKGTGVHAYDQRWTLEPEKTGSRFTFTEHVELPYGAFGRVIGRFAQRTSEGHLKEMLTKLKELAEARPAES